jgi:hypothetical protein
MKWIDLNQESFSTTTLCKTNQKYLVGTEFSDSDLTVQTWAIPFLQELFFEKLT